MAPDGGAIEPVAKLDLADGGADHRGESVHQFEPMESQANQLLVESRGIWVSRWDYHSEADVRSLIQEAALAGFNQVYFQIRGEADAYYRSSQEPWAAALSGKLGQDPGWDPLAVAIEEAHLLNIELHAWLNVATGWRGKVPPGKSKPTHILRAHPDWRVVMKNGQPMKYSDGYVFVNLAHPGVQKHLETVIGEIASFYAIDGLHLDYIRYPSNDTSYDRISNKLYQQAKKENPQLERDEWQRKELTLLVHRLSLKAKETKPQLSVSAAVIGIYQNRWGWENVTQGLVDFHQDSHLWAQEKVVDGLAPMIYWPPSNPKGGRADFATLLEDFAPLSERVGLLAGISADAGDFSTLVQEIELVRAMKKMPGSDIGYSGVVLFSYELLKKNGYLEQLKETVFAQPAVPWLPDL